MIHNQEILDRLKMGNSEYLTARTSGGDISPEKRDDTAEHGQHPYAIVITCSDSRVIPEAIFSAGIGELFVIRVAGNVIGSHQLGSIEYAAAHLGCKVILVLGHTNCGAVGAAIQGGGEGFIKSLTDEIIAAIGAEKEDYKACEKNVRRGVETIQKQLAGNPEALGPDTDVIGAIYDVKKGYVDWLA